MSELVPVGVTLPAEQKLFASVLQELLLALTLFQTKKVCGGGGGWSGRVDGVGMWVEWACWWSGRVSEVGVWVEWVCR